MNVKRFLFIICALFTAAATQAQISKDIMRVLDGCSKTFKSAGDIKARYEAAQFENKEELGSSRGTICISGKKLYLENENAKIWFDGKTQWAYVQANGEVSVTEPSAAERAQMNPYAFLSIYKTGYAGAMTTETVRGEECYSVTLTATKRAAMPAVLLTISKKTMLPICIRTKTGAGKWTRISILGFEKRQRFGAGTFVFNAADYPEAEVVDLR